MIFLLYGYGNHSNRLFQSIHFEAFCLENNIGFKNLAFDDMYPLYDCGEISCRRWRIVRWGLDFVRKVLDKTGIRCLCFLDYNKLASQVNPPRTCVVWGWNFRRGDLTKKYRNVFKEKYALKSEFYMNNSFVSAFEKNRNNSICIGMHIRKGDYKEFLDGKYYYTDEQYFSVLKNVVDLLKCNCTDKKIYVYIFSNEDVADLFYSVPNVSVSKENWYIDQYLMSKMDYLFGPPSTFTSWASYIGDVPLYFMENPEVNVTMEDFRIIDG